MRLLVCFGEDQSGPPYLGPHIVLRGKHLVLFGQVPADMRYYMASLEQHSSVG